MLACRRYTRQLQLRVHETSNGTRFGIGYVAQRLPALRWRGDAPAGLRQLPLKAPRQMILWHLFNAESMGNGPQKCQSDGCLPEKADNLPRHPGGADRLYRNFRDYVTNRRAWRRCPPGKGMSSFRLDGLVYRKSGNPVRPRPLTRSCGSRPTAASTTTTA